MSSDFDYMSATSLRKLIVGKQISPVELVERALSKAASTQADLNCFFVIDAEGARAAARRAETAIVQGAPLGLLHGLPVSVKDLIAVGGLPYASGSRANEGNIAPEDAPAVERLRAAGAIIIGKTTTSEYGCKPVGDSPLTGITHNPWNAAKTPGGSSAGAAASIAAGVTPFGLGTDGGGSIRIPSSMTGLVGLKGQFGRVPVWPTSATPTLAHVGPMARNVHDAALLFTAIAGYDARDPSSVSEPVPNVLAACRSSVAGMRLAWSPTLGYAEPDEEVVALCEKSALMLEDMGCIVEKVDRFFDEDPARLWTAEFYAGVGTRLRNTLKTKREILDPAVSDILDAALSQTMRDYYESVFARHAFYRDALKKFDDYDAVLSPVIPVSSLDCGLNKPAASHIELWSPGSITHTRSIFWAFPLELFARVSLATECLSGSRSPAGRAVNLMSFVWPPHWRQPSRPATILFTGMVSEQSFKPPLTVVGLGHAQPIPILQQLARSDPSGRNDVRAVPTVAAKRQGCPWWSAGSTAAMMLDHLGHEDASRAIMQAIETTLKNEATRTRDLGGKADTATCGGAVAAALDQQQGRVFAS